MDEKNLELYKAFRSVPENAPCRPSPATAI